MLRGSASNFNSDFSIMHLQQELLRNQATNTAVHYEYNYAGISCAGATITLLQYSPPSFLHPCKILVFNINPIAIRGSSISLGTCHLHVVCIRLLICIYATSRFRIRHMYCIIFRSKISWGRDSSFFRFGTGLALRFCPVPSLGRP